MTTQLIPVFNGTISNEPSLLCNARDLHTFLSVGKVFAGWIKARIAEYGFVENQDYIPIFQNRKIGHGRGKIEYHLTLDMAKELAMVERNDKGRQVRRYFIECEKQLHQQYSTVIAPHRECLPKMVYHHGSKAAPYQAYAWDSMKKKVYLGYFATVDEAVAAQKRFMQSDTPDISDAEKEMFIGNLRAICHNFRRIDEIWRSQLRPALEMADSKLVYLLHDRFNDSMCVLPTIESRIGKYIPPKLPR